MSTLDFKPLQDRIQLRYHILNKLGFQILLYELGFPGDIWHKITASTFYRESFILRLDHSICVWRDHLASLGMVEQDPDLNTIMYEMGQGILRLQFNCLLSHPLTVMNIERRCELRETGIKDELIKNWNIKYYSFRCLEFVDVQTCLDKTIEYDDLNMFKEVLLKSPEGGGTKLVAAIKAIRYNRLRMLLVLNINLESASQERLQLYFRAALSRDYRTVEVLEYLLMYPVARGYLATHFDAYLARSMVNTDNHQFMRRYGEYRSLIS